MKSNLRVLLITSSRARKGPVIVAQNIAKGLVQRGFDVEIWYLDGEGDLDFPCASNLFKWPLLRRLCDFDVVHSHSLRPDALAWFARVILRKKSFYVTTIHNYVEADLTATYGNTVAFAASRLWRFFWASSDACVTLTHHAKAFYRATQPNLRLETVYNSVDGHLVRPLEDSDASALRLIKERFRLIGACALITEIKGFDQVIMALKRLPNHFFVLIGDGPALRELKSLAFKCGVLDRFLCLGFRDNARDFLPYFDVYAMPSRSEGMPLAMLEAVSANVPVVCSNIPVFNEMFDPHEVAFFELDQPRSFSEAIHTAEKRAQAQAYNALLRSRLYSHNAMVDGYLKIYDIRLKEPV